MFERHSILPRSRAKRFGLQSKLALSFSVRDGEKINYSIDIISIQFRNGFMSKTGLFVMP